MMRFKARRCRRRSWRTQNGAVIVEIERTTDHGATLFEVDARGQDGTFEFDVAEDGTFRGMEANDADDHGGNNADDDDDDDDDDGDVQVTLAQCPAAVQATIVQYVGGGTINEIERSPEGNFEVDANGADGQFEFVVAGDGRYLGPEGDDDDGDNGFGIIDQSPALTMKDHGRRARAPPVVFECMIGSDGLR
jgi:hypothetical protein